MPAEIPITSQSATAAGTKTGRVRLLADDLTGACDAGAAFLTAGREVRVWLGEKALFAAAEPVQAFNTASRALPASEAAAAVARAAAAMETGAGAILFKKIDSAGRGPIAAELRAAQQALGARAILLAPGFPAAGRTVHNGILEVRDFSESANLSVDLCALFPASMRNEIALVSRAHEVAPALDSGKTVLVCDSATQEQLNAFAHTAQHCTGLLYAGSAGLARAIAHLHRATPPEKRPAALRTLVIAGTPHPVTRLQLEQLEKQMEGGATPARASVQILRVECGAGDEARIRDVFRTLEPEALILTGGDTALFAAQALGAHSILLKGEFHAGIPWGTLEGGDAHGRTVVTKSGGFGSASALNDLIAHLSGAA
jgi:D-threonate/D-erythronate kinase